MIAFGYLDTVMSRKPAPPKPEELIAKLDEKFETFKEEILKSVEEKCDDINNLKENDKRFLQHMDETSSQNHLDLEVVQKSSDSVLEESINKIQR